MESSITFFGTRGSRPAIGNEFKSYGSETSCYGIVLNGTSVIADCGTGVVHAGSFLNDLEEVHLFLTHPHLDHLGGLFDLMDLLHGKPLHIYGRTLAGRSVREQVEAYAGEPLWPVTPSMTRNVFYHDLDGTPVEVGNIRVRMMDSNHPGGCTIYRFDSADGSIVLAADFNHADGYQEKLIRFAMNCDLLVYDGSMPEEEYQIHGSWGHSTAAMGGEIGQACHAERVAITHHGPRRTDQELDREEHVLRQKYDNLFYAYNGLRLTKDSPKPGYCYQAGSRTFDSRLDTLMDVSMNLSTAKDHDMLFESILRSAVSMCSCDAGTLYSLKNNALNFEVMITKSRGYFRGGSKGKIDLPPVRLEDSNICAYAANHRKTVNIRDVYDSSSFDFSGPRHYDRITGYHTGSVLVVPMIDFRGNVIGVIQLINAMDAGGMIVPFTKSDEQFTAAITSQAAVALTNINYSRQIVELLYGFVRSTITGIDERSPYNANHTRNMVDYGKNFLRYEAEIKGPYAVNLSSQEEITFAIWLHDLGKIATPLEIMDKAERLTEGQKKDISHRFEKMELLLELQAARNEISAEECAAMRAQLRKEKEFIHACSHVGFLDDEKLAGLRAIAAETYRDMDGTLHQKLTPEELHELEIRKGTLTEEERKIMQNHVVMTRKMLSELNFPQEFSKVPEWASRHHELLDGSGYPDHLTAKDLAWQSRLITILDIFEALTASDRPYRKAMPMEKAVGILHAMADEGKLDEKILNEFIASRAWVKSSESAS
jgi:HD-GYP domain-containing protein (c-di-GMP phosphodiesterase class II)/ribonuclease BN (tRNA processing enzyme)